MPGIIPTKSILGLVSLYLGQNTKSLDLTERPVLFLFCSPLHEQWESVIPTVPQKGNNVCMVVFVSAI